MSGVSWSSSLRQLVAQQELSFLQPLHLQLISLAGGPERLDRRVEVAVFFAQPLELGDQPRVFLRREPLLIHSCALYVRLSTLSTLAARLPLRTPVQFNVQFRVIKATMSEGAESSPKMSGFRRQYSQRGGTLPLASVAGYVTISLPRT